MTMLDLDVKQKIVNNMNNNMIDNEFVKKINKEIVEKIKRKWANEAKENNRKQKWYFKFLK